MKILFLRRSSVFNRRGGSEIQLYYLMKEFRKKDYEIHYLFESNKKISEKNEGVHYHLLHDYTKKFSLLNFLKVGILIKKISPDIIYQRAKSVYTGIAAFFAKLTNTKMIYSISSDTDCLKKSKNLPGYINTYFGNYGIKKANLVISQTCHQKNLLKKNYNIESTIIPNGHPIPSPPFRKSKPIKIVWIANIKPLKQPEVFIKLAEKCKKLNVQFLYAGRPNRGEYQRMLLDNTKKISNLKYLGEIPFEKTNELLSESSILVNTSLVEGFSNTFIQAWMRETPVVTLYCDPDDIIKNQKIGFHSGSFEKLVKDVVYLIENDKIRSEMGKKAREYAIKNYDIEKIGKRYVDIFEELKDRRYD